MTTGDWIVLAVLAVVLFFIVRYLRKSKENACTGDCSHCGSTCSHIDWQQVKKEIHEDRKHG